MCIVVCECVFCVRYLYVCLLFNLKRRYRLHEESRSFLLLFSFAILSPWLSLSFSLVFFFIAILNDAKLIFCI